VRVDAIVCCVWVLLLGGLGLQVGARQVRRTHTGARALLSFAGLVLAALTAILLPQATAVYSHQGSEVPTEIPVLFAVGLLSYVAGVCLAAVLHLEVHLSDHAQDALARAGWMIAAVACFWAMVMLFTAREQRELLFSMGVVPALVYAIGRAALTRSSRASLAPTQLELETENNWDLESPVWLMATIAEFCAFLGWTMVGSWLTGLRLPMWLSWPLALVCAYPVFVLDKTLVAVAYRQARARRTDQGDDGRDALFFRHVSLVHGTVFVLAVVGWIWVLARQSGF